MSAIRCELWIEEDGADVIVRRADGCTPEDVVDMCRLVAVGDSAVQDVRTGDR
jgi:hypothetical protein